MWRQATRTARCRTHSRTRTRCRARRARWAGSSAGRGRSPSSPTSCTPPSRPRSWSPRPTPARSASPPMNESPYDGQWRQLAWLLVARGARLIEYWHWNTLPFGAETYWGGVLPHSGIPGRAYEEIARTGQELREAGGAFGTAEPDYDIAVLYDSDSKFALSTQGPLRGDVLADPDSYRHIVAAFSRGIFDAKRQQRLVRPQHLLPSRGGEHDAAHAAALYPVLIAAALLHRGRRGPGLPGQLCAGRAVPRRRTANGLRGRGRKGAHRASAGPDRGRGRRLVRRDGFAAVTGAGGRLVAWRGDGVRRRARRLGRGGPRRLSASAPQPLGRRHHKGRRGGRITVIGTVPDQVLAAGLVRWLAPRVWTGGPPAPRSPSPLAPT